MFNIHNYKEGNDQFLSKVTVDFYSFFFFYSLYKRFVNF